MIDYTCWVADLSQANLKKLVKHCDQKIDKFFAALDKKMPKLIEREVKKQLAKKPRK